jgi:uncharacterized protein (TIGR02099 family)
VSRSPGRGSTARIWRLLAGTFASLVILAALVLGLLRFALAQVPDNAVRIQGWIERQTNLRLEFATIDARMRWWGPEVVLRDVRVLDRDADQALFATREANVSLDAWSLFRTGELVAGRIRFVGPAVTVVRLPDGRIRLLGQRERPADRPVFDLDRLPAGRLDIADATVRYEDRLTGRGPWQLGRVQLSLRRAQDAVDVTGSARLPAEIGARIEFDGELRGSLERRAELGARLEVRADRLALAGLADFLPERVAQPDAGAGHLRAIVNVAQGRLRQLRAEFDFADVSLILPRRELPPIETVELSERYRPAGASPLSMRTADKTEILRAPPELPREARYARMAGTLRLRHEGETWTFRATDLVLRGDRAASGSPLSLGGSWRGHPASAFHLQVHAEWLHVADLWPLVLATAPAGFDRWAGLDPSGEIRSLYADVLRERAGSEPRFAASAVVEGLSVRPAGRWPGVAGVTASLSGTEERGRIALPGLAPTFEWPRMFRETIALERVATEVDWWRDGGTWVLGSPRVALAHSAGTAGGSFELRLGPDRGLPFLTAEARVEGLDVTAVRQFLPIGRLRPTTLIWLDEAFERGEVSAGRLSYRGPVRSFPFRQGEGEFVATAEVEGATLKYFEGFPPLTEAVGSVEFRNASTRANLREGRVGGLRVGATSFEIKDYREPVLELGATAAGDVGQALELLQKSPLGPQLGEQFMALSGQGPADFAFDMKLPTGNVAAREYSVRTRFRSATARWPVLREPVTRITGELEIGERSARGEGLKGTYLDGPFEISVRPGAVRAGAAASILFEGEGRAAGEKLPAVIGLPATIRMTGSTPWKLQGRLEQPARGATWTTRFEVESDLGGLGIDAPRPFAKPTGDRRPTRVELDVPRPGQTDLRIESGAAHALLEFARGEDQRWRLERGAARFDGQAPARPTRPGLHVGGDWPEFDLGEWLALRSDSPGDTRLGDWLGPVDVHLDRARVIGFEFRDVNAGLRPAGGGWSIDVSGPMAEGRVSIPANLSSGDPIELQMQRLELESPEGRGGSGPREETDPRELPAIVLRAEDFAWQGRRFGRLEADLARDPRGLRLANLATRSDAFALRASGSWFVAELGSRTSLAVEFESEDLAAASRALGYRDAVESERARITADVGWSGGPDADALARMDGTLRLDLGRGQLRSVKPGAGRILGLTSIIELPRRLSLDFRDVTDEGLSFDTVTGDFELRAGSAYTENLLLEGAAVDIGVVGRTGLAAQDYDQTVIVSGNPSGPITIAGALAGGPVGAAGALLFSQLFKGQLQGLARAYYRVTGPWSEPVVERISASVGTSQPTSTPPAEPPPTPPASLPEEPKP